MIQNIVFIKWSTSFFDKRSSGSGADASLANKYATEPNYQPGNELHRHIIRKFKKGNIYSSLKDNICGVDLADMQSFSKCNKRIKYLFCASIYLFRKYARVIP